MEELHVGWLREREEGDVLLPAYLRSAELPAYIRTMQYVDVRENDPSRIRDLASSIIERLGIEPRQSSPPASASASASASARSRASATVQIPPEAIQSLLAGDMELQVEITLRLAPVAGRLGVDMAGPPTEEPQA